MEKIKRRTAIKHVSLIMGGALSSSLVAGVLAGCEAESTLDWTPKALTSTQATIAGELAERILPATHTPGAKEARVERFIDSMVDGYLVEEERNTFLEGLAFLRRRKFTTKTTQEQDQIVAELVEAARKQNKEDKKKPFFLIAKQMILLGFFTSEVGATQVLNYDPIPGAYLGCEPLEDVGGKVWAT